MSVRIFIEYKVKSSHVHQYEQQMKNVLSFLPTFGADQINWFHEERDSKYIESFLLPTISHYVALKKIRAKTCHTIFGILDQFIEGGIQNIQIHAVKVQ
ncbi:hypothetical protein ACFSCX_24725 [Bacillus salitolerans]|uniref:Uncharacterized protein n=1 Tax=Bacillus salitolerans TaxID=1437434 RepID=A0ABW4LZM4_9BACI